MSNDYKAMYREPSKPHQCMHNSEEDGTRCRAIAMHNEMMCYHHRPDCILPVIENEPFLLENLDTREAIQRALGQVAHQLACNRMDFERARLLIHVITAAMRNLPPHPRTGRTVPTPTQSDVILSEEHRDESKDPETLDPVSTDQTIPPPNPAESDTAAPVALHAAALSSSREASRTARSAPREASRTARSASPSLTLESECPPRSSVPPARCKVLSRSPATSPSRTATPCWPGWRKARRA